MTRARSRVMLILEAAIVLQVGHQVEHFAQMFQMHIDGQPPAFAHGLVGRLDLEWVHFGLTVTIALVALIALARRYHVTLFMLLLACYYTLLYRYTGQDDIIVGAPVAGRQHTELEPIIGIFINTLILRAELQDSHTFEDVVKKVQRTTLDAFEHQALPFPKLVDELNVERVPGYPPLYQVVFNFQNASLIESSDPFAEGESLVRDGFPLVHSNTSKVDLNLTITQRDAGISGGVEYNTDLFDPGTIDAMIAHLEVIAETVVSDPSIPLMDIPLTAAVHDAAVRERGPVEGGRFSFELSD